MTRFTLTTLGCKVNQYDGRAVAGTLEAMGLVEVPSGDGQADLVVVNTCCITSVAMRKARQALRQAIRRSPGAGVLVTGCYADYAGARLARLAAELGVRPDRIAIAGHHEDVMGVIRHVVGWFDQPVRAGGAASCVGVRPGAEGYDESMKPFAVACGRTAMPAIHKSITASREAAVKNRAPGTDGLRPIRGYPGRQRAFVKIQDGCDAFCTYCVVPYTRPRVRSRRPEAVLEECRGLVASGHREIVLCGVFLGAYGRRTARRRRWRSAPQASLTELVRRVAEIDGLWRVRLSSLEPGDVTEDLLAVMAENPRVAPHLHLPLQSGSDSVLRRMARQYSADDYRRAVDLARAGLDRPAITADVIAGFPGETEEDFARTLSMVRQAEMAKVHAFPFSAIPGTAAWRFRDDAASPEAVRRRMAELANAEAETARRYRRRFVGQALDGLVENSRCEERRAITDRHLPVAFDGPGTQPGDVVRLEIVGVFSEGLRGELRQGAGAGPSR